MTEGQGPFVGDGRSRGTAEPGGRGRTLGVPRGSRTIQLDVSRGRGQQLKETEAHARLPDGAQPGLVTQRKEDKVHAEAQDSWRNREKGLGSGVASANGGGGGGGDGDDARERGFALTNARFTQRQTGRTKYSAAQCLARGRAGGQAEDRCRSKPEQTGTGKFLKRPAQHSTAVASQTPDFSARAGTRAPGQSD